MLPSLLVTIFFFAVVLFLLAREDGPLGIRFRPVHCPHCGKRTPQFRKPTSFGQAMRGGWTCKACGTEMDRAGHRLDRVA